MRNLIYVATLALVACGYSEDKYAEDFAAKYCDQLVECGQDPCADATTTETTDTTPVDDSCEFDSGAAKECIDAAWECSEEVAGFNEYAELAMVPTWRELGTNRLQLMAEIRTAEGQFKRVRLLATTPGVMTDPS